MVQKIEHGVGEAECAAKLSVAAVKRHALQPDFFKVNRDISGVPGVIELDVNIFFVNRLEIAASCEFGQADFQRVRRTA